MLTSLSISNYALIDRLEIEFGKGLNIITGETGAGKSILLGALSLVCGERADLKTVRDSSRKTIVEAVFTHENDEVLTRILTDNDIDVIEDVCILRRELTAKGNSRAFINDTPVTVALLKTVSDLLVDIHSQHENMLLGDADFQLDILDALGGNAALKKEYSDLYVKYRASLKEYTDFRDQLKRNIAENEYNIFLLSQLDELNLTNGEQQSLEQEREIVANATEIKMHLEEALSALARRDEDALTLISRATDHLGKIAEFVGESESLYKRLENARIELKDVADTLEEYEASVSANGNDLEAIEMRLDKIYSLEARHNVRTDAELIEIREKLRQKVKDVVDGDEKLHDLETSAKKLKKELVTLARELTSRRESAAAMLSNKVVELCRPLGMTNLRCEIRLTPDKLKLTGADNVQFLFAFNKNQPLMPVGKTASGGETARLVLALKYILVDKMRLPTIIFDEIDTGVSGDIANRMAALMTDISKTTQVITITHIAAVAAHGERHFKVYKEDDSSTTNTNIAVLDYAGRLRELAVMISGDADDAVSLETARVLLSKNN